MKSNKWIVLNIIQFHDGNDFLFLTECETATDKSNLVLFARLSIFNVNWLFAREKVHLSKLVGESG